MNPQISENHFEWNKYAVCLSYYILGVQFNYKKETPFTVYGDFHSR